MRPTQNCLLKYLQQNTHEAIGPQNGLVASFLKFILRLGLRK
nr:MAG TPA: hypothetical protein [Caudoviricetes sp.]